MARRCSGALAGLKEKGKKWGNSSTLFKVTPYKVYSSSIFPTYNNQRLQTNDVYFLCVLHEFHAFM
ncbi:MAG: hypothetical protein LBB81_10515 [Treponema sp.]|nr:hypothetical protein [Treponema sp.]